jgi:hypothetical protein
MRSTSRWLALASLSLAAACGASIEVRTMAAPDASLAGMGSFRLLPSPVRRDGRPPSGDDDPMISNSIANRAIRAQITRSFQDRGYTLNELNPDFVVAFYATAHEKLDVTAWDYGYPFSDPSHHAPRQAPVAVAYMEGSVVIDVIKAGTGTLLWCGEGRAALGNDPSESVKLLTRAADAIVSKFPSASPRVVADRR